MKQRRWLLWIALVSAAVLGLVIFLHEGDTVPTHYGISGAADAYGSKWIYLMFAAIPFIIIGVMALLERSAADKTKLASTYSRAFSGLTLLFIAMGWLFTVSALSGAEQAQALMLPGLLLVMGAFYCWLSPALKDAQPNRLVGIRTAATLSDAEVWHQTHAMAAKSGWLGGLMMMAEAVMTMLIPQAAPIILPIGLLSAIICWIIPAVYAQRLAKDKAKRQ